MKKMYLLFFATLLIFSCAKDNNLKEPGGIPVEKGKEYVEFSIRGMNTPSTRAAGNAGGEISDATLLDSLIKDIKILVFDHGNDTCRTYADFDPVRLSQENALNMAVETGTKDFIIITNVTDPALISDSLVGKTDKDILALLKEHSGILPYDKIEIDTLIFWEQPGHIFYGQIENILVEEKKVTEVNIELVRIISQLTTIVDTSLVYDAEGVNLTPGYIKELKRIGIQNVSPDVSLVGVLNNQPFPYSASKAVVIGDRGWIQNDSDPKIFKNHTLTFPTENLGLKPYVLIEAEVNTESTEKTRYWGIQLTKNFLRKNVKLELTINKLIGEGSTTIPGPNASSTCEFTLKVLDWDEVTDTEEGDASS